MKTPMIQIGTIGKDAQGQRVYSPEGISTSINSQAGGLGKKTGLYEISPCIRSEHHNTEDVHFIISKPHGYNKGGNKELPSLRSSSMEHNDFVASAVDCDGYLRRGERPRDENGKPQLLPIGYRRIRRLTPIECERLQGFPDGWTEGISDTQRYKCLGNACSVPVVRAVGERVFK